VPPIVRCPVVVGRGAELALARERLAALADGTGGTLLITGEAGIGKSRLVAEIATTAENVYRGRAVHGGGTYRAISEALAASLRGQPLDTAQLRPYRAALCRLAPGWDDKGEPEPGVDPTVVLGEGLIALLATKHGERPRLFVLEDLHWADPDTIGLLTYLADAVAGTPTLLVLTARDDESAPGIAALARHPMLTMIQLRRLKASEVGQLAAACRGGIPLPGKELTELVARTDGLPFLVEELLDPDTTNAPTLAGLVTARLNSLQDQHRKVIMAAAMVDPDWRLLQAVTGLPEGTVVAALKAATGVGLLDEQVQWRHALTQDAVLATMFPPERAALAARAAEVLDGKERAAELFELAGQPQRAAEVLVNLAARDATRGALRSAEDLLNRATRTGELAGAVAAERVRVLSMLGSLDEALSVGEQAFRAGQVTGQAHAELCLRLARAAVTGGRWAAAEAYVERAGRPDDPRSMVLAADAAFGAGQVDRAAELARAVDHDQIGATPEVLCEALMLQSRIVQWTNLPGAATLLGRAAQVAAEHNLVFLQAEALFLKGAVELTDGDLTLTSLESARELAEEAGLLALTTRIDLLWADATLVVTGPRPALERSKSAIAAADRLHMPGVLGIIEICAAFYAALVGERDLAESLLRTSAARADIPPEVATLGPVVRAMSHLLNHDLPAADRLVDDGITALLPHGSSAPVPYFGLWALLRTATGDGAAARETLRGHHAICAIDNRAALTYAQAIAEGRAGRRQQAANLFADASATMADLPWWNRFLRLITLECAVADGWGDPVRELRADLVGFEESGDHQLARTCRDLLRAAGAETRRGRGSSKVPQALRALGVTSREADVLALVVEGLTNAQVAERLFLSPRTVETHVTNLLAKTGAATRYALREVASSRASLRDETPSLPRIDDT
jgi:DNA-binding CsgD family transcriptional regulator